MRSRERAVTVHTLANRCHVESTSSADIPVRIHFGSAFHMAPWVTREL